jgi:hypothetical protein
MGIPGAGTLEGGSGALLEKPRVLRVEPIRQAGGVGSVPEPPAVLEAPDLIEPLVAFRAWRVIDGRLRSPYLPVFWEERVMAARCRRKDRPSCQSRMVPHTPPHFACGCGIHAYYEPDASFPTVDYRGVTGIVSLWGKVEVRSRGLRSEFARIEALARYSHWSSRQQAAVAAIARELGVELVALGELASAADRYGERLNAPAHRQLLLPA